ncbi:hypothetical protein LZ518_06255 [Sphingomonas sp. RB56-2]|uniref:Uncharacterized protein n=1 Tax=Sphingomonas brevis TaxID=2908206 RepID=A0ABT0S8L3_9SPHN|nr:hypothetical protein [Sphingomonas brevis]MCL6740734.1 hypothetical protein [Sphingomonas brevis]
MRHRSALVGLASIDGQSLVREIFDLISRNYDVAGATGNKDRSKQNWRWHSLQPQISSHNRSPEVVVERAIAAACLELGRSDWANQIPVASGLIPGAGDGRRAIDLVRRHSAQHFELIELKIASDTPLYAAVEIVGYCCLWLIARNDRPKRVSPLLEATEIGLSVLAPTGYYERYSLADVERSFDQGIAALGRSHGIAMSFSFLLLDDRIRPAEMPPPQPLLDLLTSPHRLFPR